MHVRLATQAGQPYDARTLAKDVRWLWSLGRFDDIRVEEPAPRVFVFRVTPRPRFVLRDARLTPHSYGIDLRLPPGTPIDALRAREIARDVERQLGLKVDESLLPRGKGKADLRLHVAGGKKRKRPPPSDEIRYSVAKDVCRDLFRERAGRLDFRAEFLFDAGMTTDPGRPYRVGRIEFTGHHRFSDGLVRGHLLLAEGDPFDERLLRRSLARLNRSGLFDPIGERQVVVARDEAAGIAHITMRLTERGRGAWRVAGPWPLHASLSLRLPKWATYAVSLTPYGPALERPYLPGAGWKSGFAIAPQLGLRAAGIGYVAGQVLRRVRPFVSGERSLEGPLPVGGDIAAVCVAKPRLGFLRSLL